MPRREKEPLERVHLHLYARDVERLKRYFGHVLPINRAVRSIVRQRLDAIEAKIIAKQDTSAPPLPEADELSDEVEIEA